MAKAFKLKRRRPVIVFLPESRSGVVVSTLVTNGFHVAEVWSVPELFDAIRSGQCAAVVTSDTSIALVLAIGSIRVMDANVYFVLSNQRSTFDQAGFLNRISLLVDADGQRHGAVCDVTHKNVSGHSLGRLLKALKLIIFGRAHPPALK
ncbi:hypothetical protein LAV84_27335 [Rhizobium sp. VS19-DR104.2]|uniref:hypothetical protein n=1 Tax=unclassified Rhizobium TaxID=2613769 RepID=UPI001C5B1129|nr:MULTISPECIES: hypothetical protein [unclassified Rhizobium]MBZ5763273.1 hypothetical protein [Rhizobium sp. VS19-DR96]MBZ5769378.1 hypothetical protein [Rhizobium sp. VS19-DR129.2]MBZ5776916.1 hypothetical protein [Rhizobium sp. VS19-DRK62.2]MBZ5787856.1 hypothetical protein [Rhizobium sp. VS19-DR121]MBZ5805331.1 hypothetical protein [Rhizobium sp. VS19-DR181]